MDSTLATYPVDSLFVSGPLCLDRSLENLPPSGYGQGNILFTILCIASLMAVIVMLKRFVNIFPSLMACLIRWKEAINLEASVKLTRDRNITAGVMIMPFCLTASFFNLYSPSYMDSLEDNLRLLVVIGVFAAYLLLRRMLDWMMASYNAVPRKNYGTACRSSYNFFILTSLVMLALGGILEFIGVNPDVTRQVLIWLLGGSYILSIVRKTQIFASYCSLLQAFLYLCALEIAPTGILIASGIVF